MGVDIVKTEADKSENKSSNIHFLVLYDEMTRVHIMKYQWTLWVIIIKSMLLYRLPQTSAKWHHWFVVYHLLTTKDFRTVDNIIVYILLLTLEPVINCLIFNALNWNGFITETRTISRKTIVLVFSNFLCLSEHDMRSTNVYWILCWNKKIIRIESLE